jgi:deoxyribodipyrimidine photo-lyase
MLDHPPPILVWFRCDLRLADHPALTAAVEAGAPVVPVFVLDQADTARGSPGAAGRWWLHHSLQALASALEPLGAPLILRRGDPGLILAELAAATGARAVYCNQVSEPWSLARDREIAGTLAERGVGVATFAGSLLFDPDSIRSGAGRPYTTFGPFWRACQARPAPGRPLPAPVALRPAEAAAALASEPLAGWELTAARPEGWLSWTPGEAAARERLAEFLEDAIISYREDRDRFDWPGTSQLSPHLRWGEISARSLWHAVSATLDRGAGDASRQAFLRQLGWREFSAHLLRHYPELPARPLNRRFDGFPWQADAVALAAWRDGRTGYPIIDAAMRQLRATGWMHNRLRMITASFLVKHLLVPWQDGAAWFHETLVDADLANNSASWQWVAGCGTDAAPFFRIFSPVLQSRRYDPEGGLIRRWLPELAGLPAEHIHEPWRAPPAVLDRAGVRLGQSYPRPIVDHAAARSRALCVYQGLSRTGGPEPEPHRLSGA